MNIDNTNDIVDDYDDFYPQILSLVRQNAYINYDDDYLNQHHLLHEPPNIS